MASDDISTPLGVDLEASQKPKRSVPLGSIAGSCLGLVFVALLGYAFLVRDPLGGEPVAVAAIAVQEPEVTPVSAPVSKLAVQEPVAPEMLSQSTAQELETDSGITVHRGNGSAPAAVVIQVPDDVPKSGLEGIDPALSESSRHGLLPIISRDGRRPLDVYARKSAGAASNKPKIAIIVGGLGIGQTVTAQAVRKLPAEMTLAFAPYGNELGRQVAKARENGHEIMLQMPMEPFDYPDNDPGPQTLVAGQKPAETRDRLQWLLSRFQGYMGVMNFMGAKFMASEPDFAIVAQELAQRGLGFVDDGTALANTSAAQVLRDGGSALSANIQVDAIAKPDAIDAALAKLEDIARAKGSAVGVSSALPLTIERLERWSQSLKARGIVLVPVSALLRGSTG